MNLNRKNKNRKNTLRRRLHADRAKLGASSLSFFLGGTTLPSLARSAYTVNPYSTFTLPRPSYHQ
jgi:hypothetical protein